MVRFSDLGSRLKTGRSSMSQNLNELPLRIDPESRDRRTPWGVLACVILLTAGALAWGSGHGLSSLLASRESVVLAVREVDRGDVTAVVTEYGSLESADNVTVRCKVEAIVGQPGTGGTANRSAQGAGGAGGAQGGAGGGAASGADMGGAAAKGGATAKS